LTKVFKMSATNEKLQLFTIASHQKKQYAINGKLLSYTPERIDRTVRKTDPAKERSHSSGERYLRTIQVSCPDGRTCASDLEI
jgi:hypothetical protein